MDDDAIQALVTRLSRPAARGGDTIERAAILAAGSDSAAVVDWILAHGGAPEETGAAGSARGLHSPPSRGNPNRASPPARYLLPAGWQH